MATERRPSPQTLAVLRELAGQESGWGHGYDLCGRLALKPGTVYPILIRLAERGLVETAWEQDAPPGRPPRHLYRLSSAGAEYLAGQPVAAGRATSPSPVATRRPAGGTAGA